ncbi:BrnT family toxin [Bradyrhizobium sp. AUGA SZCCT0169]|jgi:uncharacterized DUF497 family protein|uniref:BrnT family toxin n=1 Tax=Bradyrhizobium sp. AUGA SZCCT0169 TaxID=2807663 RepID=UPI002897F433|nr:BrnT family toxin [Bradyrhizobium sp. AUGA SZCCT0169]
MKIIWDEPKRLANLAKHGMDFADLNERFFDQAFVLPALGNRHRAIGVNIRGVICVVFRVLRQGGHQHHQHAPRQQH